MRKKKEGEFIEYKSDYSDLNNNNIENQTIEIKNGESNEIKNIEPQKAENIKRNRYMNM